MNGDQNLEFGPQTVGVASVAMRDARITPPSEQGDGQLQFRVVVHGQNPAEHRVDVLLPARRHMGGRTASEEKADRELADALKIVFRNAGIPEDTGPVHLAWSPLLLQAIHDAYGA